MCNFFTALIVDFSSIITEILISDVEIARILIFSSANDLNILYVTPGVRLANDKLNDQKRIITPGQAVKSGSSMLIIGRAISSAKNPVEKIKEIYDDIEVQLES